MSIATETISPQTHGMCGSPDAVVADTDANCADGPLARAARPVLDQLAVDLRDAPVGLVLTNERGRVVDLRVANAALTVRPDGMASAMTSAGAPIVDPRSAHRLGAIDLTAPNAEANPLILALAVRAAREIELRLVDDTGLSERLLLHRFLQQRRRVKGPVVFLTDRMMIINAAAGRLVGSDDEATLRAHSKHARLAANDDVAEIVLANGATVSVHLEPLIDAGERVGDLLRLKPVDPTRAGRPQKRDRHRTFGWVSLTDTERTVVELVAEGLTNREAGERLFLSHHTVGFHLRSIFNKLGVASRLELARIVFEREAEQLHAATANVSR
jgi:DNA-binding CsgD family transcriptional regulator